MAKNYVVELMINDFTTKFLAMQILQGLPHEIALAFDDMNAWLVLGQNRTTLPKLELHFSFMVRKKHQEETYAKNQIFLKQPFV